MVGTHRNAAKRTDQAHELLVLLASKWVVPVITTLRHGVLRYSAIEKALPDVTQRSLTMTLQKLERSGMVERRVYPTIPPQTEYKLTSLGLELLKLCEILSDWEGKHEAEIQRAQKAYDRYTS